MEDINLTDMVGTNLSESIAPQQVLQTKPVSKLIALDCKICKNKVEFEVLVKERPHYPFSFVFYHGLPLHAIIVYMDAHYKVRGSEIAEEFGGLEKPRTGNFVKKCIVVGDWGVGKTSLVELVTHNRFASAYDPTLALGIQECTFSLSDQTSVKVAFWEAAGQNSPRNDMMRKRIYPSSDAALIICDVTRADSFERVGEILKDIKLFAGQRCAVVGLANKVDLKGERKVSSDAIKTYSERYGIPFYEISVKDRFYLDEFLSKWLNVLSKQD